MIAQRLLYAVAQAAHVHLKASPYEPCGNSIPTASSSSSTSDPDQTAMSEASLRIRSLTRRMSGISQISSSRTLFPGSLAVIRLISTNTSAESTGKFASVPMRVSSSVMTPPVDASRDSGERRTWQSSKSL